MPRAPMPKGGSVNADERSNVERTGFATGYDGTLGARQMAEYMSRADGLGYEVGFFSETIELLRDAPTSMTAFALSTNRMQLGCTMIARLRSPIVMAQTIASLNEISNGRTIVAVGACTRSHAVKHSLPHLDPPGTLTEWVETIRLLLTGEEVTYDGQFVKLNKVGLGYEPRFKEAKILIPAISRTGLELAAAIGDGVVLTSISSPEYSANAISILRQAVTRNGRDWDEFEVAQLVNCSISEDKDAAFDAIRWEIATNFNPVQLPFVVRPRMRVGEPTITEDDISRLEAAYETGGEAALVKAIPDRFVEGLTASGAPRDVKARVDQYRRAGVKLPLIRPASLNQIPIALDLFSSAGHGNRSNGAGA
ncbi:MAG: LLM class flavin-dependent oxidoreductase [Actinobacteria bacterium]|nr:LLM class flavin-dependent oxidoreductase [Actinomycetota bacterium]